MMELTTLTETFEKLYGEKEVHTFFAPGRINLIGEHTDYNGGNVFPCAITLGTYGLISKREDSLVQLYSENFPGVGVISFDLADLTYKKEDNWANYPKGVVKYLTETGHTINSGFDMLVYGNIPNGAGLSSSASIELLMGVALEGVFSLTLDRLDLIQIGKKVENEFIGVNSGIMDQFAVGMGEKDKAILLDTNTLEYELVPINLTNHVVVIMNSNKRRELADSKYNERRSECEQALSELHKELDVASLGDLDEATFDAHTHLISNEVLVRRAKHAVYENQRTLKATKALKEGDLESFGKLMNESHLSTQHDYEVTGMELDTLVHTAWKQPGVIGARMTGAGFGGCAIAIVEKDQTEAFIQQVGAEYAEKVGYNAEFYIAEISDGAKRLQK